MRTVAGSILLMVGTAASLFAQATAADVDRLIVIGRANRTKDLTYACTAKTANNAFGAFGLTGMAIQGAVNKGKTSYDATVLSNRGLIARDAWMATQATAPFTAADVSTDLVIDGLFVVVSPRLPDPKSKDAPVLPDPVTDVVIRTYGNKTVLLKTRAYREEAGTWRNAAGATVDYTRQIRQFDLSGLERAELALANETDQRNPRDIADLVFVTAAGERICDGVPWTKIRRLVGAKVK